MESRLPDRLLQLLSWPMLPFGPRTNELVASPPARRAATGLLVAAVALVAGFACAPAPGPEARGVPIAADRVILITIDTLRADHLPCYGYSRDTAPFLCALAERGVLFEEAISSSSHTAPSHATIFTSLTPVQHKVLVNGESLDPAILTLAGRFAASGYVTAAFTSVGFLRAIASGFDHVDARASGWESVYRPADATTAAAREWIRRRRVPEKLFLWIHLYDVHHWYRPDVIDAEGLARIRGDDPGGGHRLARSQIDSDPSALEQFADADELADVIDRYDAQISFVDRQIEGVYRIMERTGHLHGSLWIITSDHGEGLGRHGYGGHGRHLYEEQVRVPLIVHDPDGVLRPRRIDTAVGLVDVYPTLAEILAAGEDGRSGSPEPIQVIPPAGRSLVPLLRRGGTLEPADFYLQRRSPKAKWGPGDLYGLRTAGFKYLHHSEEADELYDLRVDPLELHDLLADPPPTAADLPARLAELHDRMQRQAAAIAGGAFDPEHLEELRALGYVQ